MAPMKKNRNRERQNVVRRRGKNSSKKSHKYPGGSDGSRVEKRTKRRTNGYRLETSGIRSKRKYQRMGAGRYSKLARGETRESYDSGSDSRDKSEDLSAKQYIRKALEFGLASGYLTPDENSGRQVLRVASDIMQFGGSGGAGRSGSEERPDGSSTGGQGRRVREAHSKAAGKRLTTKGRSARVRQKNIRKRGRSRTRSPRKPVTQKRPRKLSASGSKTKARAAKRKRASEAKNDEPAARKRATKTAESDDDDDNGEDADPDVDGNQNNEGTKKLPASTKSGSAVPQTDNRTNNDEKKGDDEPSGEESTDEEEEEEDGPEAVDVNEEDENIKSENS